MSDINVSPAVADTATIDAATSNGNGHHPEPATAEATVTEQNSPVGQPAIPDGPTTGATPAPVTDTQANAIPAKGSINVKDRKPRNYGKPAQRDRGNL